MKFFQSVSSIGLPPYTFPGASRTLRRPWPTLESSTYLKKMGSSLPAIPNLSMPEVCATYLAPTHALDRISFSSLTGLNQYGPRKQEPSKEVIALFERLRMIILVSPRKACCSKLPMPGFCCSDRSRAARLESQIPPRVPNLASHTPSQTFSVSALMTVSLFFDMSSTFRLFNPVKYLPFNSWMLLLDQSRDSSEYAKTGSDLKTWYQDFPLTAKTPSGMVSSPLKDMLSAFRPSKPKKGYDDSELLSIFRVLILLLPRSSFSRLCSPSNVWPLISLILLFCRYKMRSSKQSTNAPSSAGSVVSRLSDRSSALSPSVPSLRTEFSPLKAFFSMLVMTLLDRSRELRECRLLKISVWMISILL
mmetsp:Transcript_55236/g.135247  ORF Transcript_55236/g.135247 Transcript_55236/m.135247 type:complete len:362 (-) Transcript_55236:1889-2974(-)